MDGDTSFLRLPPDAQEALKPAFEQFEAAWIGGREPRIEETLEDIEPAYRPAAVGGLVEIELWHRRRVAGTWPTEEFLAAAHPDLLPRFLQVRARLIADEVTAKLPPSAKSAPAEDGLPRQIGRYQILEPLGTRGGQATVSLGRDPQFHRYVAVKVSHQSSEKTPPDAPTLADEGKFLAQIRHPNVVQVYDAGLHEGRPYLVMDYVPGDRISHRFRDARAEPQVAALIVETIAEAVGAVHAETGIVHRDITPNNIIVTPRGVPMLFDFGLARLRASWVFATGHDRVEAAGTRPYMAPEQVGPVAALDERTDVFGLGGVLYFLLTGRTPCRRISDSSTWRLDDKPSLSETLAEAGCPVELAEVCLRALAARPEDRFPRASDFAVALAAWARDRTPVEASSERRSPAPPSWAWQTVAVWRGHPKIAAVTVLVALGCLIGPFVLRSDDASGSLDEPIGKDVPSPPAETAIAETAPAAEELPADVADEPDDVWTEWVSADAKLPLVFVPSGTFLMGSSDDDPDADPDERPRHEVTISRSFYMGATEVTVAQFRAFVAANEHVTDAERLDGDVTELARVVGGALFGPVRTWKEPGFEQADDHPAVYVSWNDAARFCAWLTEITGVRHRLPTEAEWEYACRAGTLTRYHSGDDAASLPRYENVRTHEDGFALTSPVGSFPANPFGLSDMHGNVAEWCADPYASDYYSEEPAVDPAGPETGEFRVRRGGSYLSLNEDCRSADRNGSKRGAGHEFVGFRVVREAEPAEIVGRWKIVRRDDGLFADLDNLWTDPVVLNADGTSSLGYGTWNYEWDGVSRFEAFEEGRPQPSLKGDLKHVWQVRLSHRRLELSQPDQTPILLERL